MDVTQEDRQLARDAIVSGWNNCKNRPDKDFRAAECDCPLGYIDGCKARVEAVALAIATARRS